MHVEMTFRSGFAAALQPALRGRSLDEAAEYLKQNYPSSYHKEGFRRGFERGRLYHQKLNCPNPELVIKR